jgi:hypothetical protein
MRIFFAIILLALALDGIAASQQRQEPPSSRPVSPRTAVAQAPAPLNTLAPAPGDVEGFVYWDVNVITHKPQGTCDGLAVSITPAGSQSIAIQPGSHFKYAGQVKAFLVGGIQSVYDVCIYAYDHQQVGPPLQAQLIITDRNAFSQAVAPQVETVAPITIINGQCNMLPRVVPSSVADLHAHWGSCQNRAYDVNFPLQPALQVMSSSRSGGMLSSANHGAPNPGPVQALTQGTLAGGINPGPIQSSSRGMLSATNPTTPTGAPSSTNGTSGQLLPRKSGTSTGNGADALNPQPFPPRASEQRIRENPLVSAADQTPKSLQRDKDLTSRAQLISGGKIRIPGAHSPAIDSITARAVESESVETHHAREALTGKTRLVAMSNVGIGPSHTLDATDPAGGGSGVDPTGGQPGSVPPGSDPSEGGSTGSGTSHLTLQQMTRAPQPISICRFTTDPAIQAVGGRAHSVVLTPDPGTGQYPNNQYAITGCNFGTVPGNVHIYGPFINNATPVNLGIDSWTDASILVTFNPTFQNEYDLKNITLVVTRPDGKGTQLPGISFVAARASRPLASVPGSLIKPPTQYFDKNIFVSPLTPTSLKGAGLAPVSQSGTVAFFLSDAIWSSNEGDGYPQNRLSYSDQIDFSKLRPGFSLDADAQTLVLAAPLSGDCKYYDTVVGASMQGSTLSIGVQPAECDDYGKYIYAYYGLILSVTGPKGNLLNPWPDGLH